MLRSSRARSYSARRRRGAVPLVVFAALGAASAPAFGQGSEPARGDPGRFPFELRYGNVEPPVVAQRDVTVRAATSIHPLDPAPLPLECSGLAFVDGQLLLTSDRHGHIVFRLPVDFAPDGVSIGLPEARQIIDVEKRLLLDAESATAKRGADGRWLVYVFCSLSNDPGGEPRVERQHLARFHVDRFGGVAEARVVTLAGHGVRAALTEHFEALGVRPYSSFNSDKGVNTPRWANVEGIAWTPDGAGMLCGLRNPTAGNDTMLFALEGVDAAFDAEDAALLRLTDLFRLDLGGRGVADLAWDPITRGYLICAAFSNGPKRDDLAPYPRADLGSALFWWSGHKADDPRPVARMLDLNLDGVCRIPETSLIALASDEGDVSEERRGRQTVITLLHFTGLAAPPAPGGGR